MLLRYKANPNVQLSNNLSTPLHIAAHYGHYDVVDKLLEYNANPNIPDMSGMVSLHWAVKKGNLKIVQRLLEFGANVDLKHSFGKTCVEIAFQEKHYDLTKMILYKAFQ